MQSFSYPYRFIIPVIFFLLMILHFCCFLRCSRHRCGLRLRCSCFRCCSCSCLGLMCCSLNGLKNLSCCFCMKCRCFCMIVCQATCKSVMNLMLTACIRLLCLTVCGNSDGLRQLMFLMVRPVLLSCCPLMRLPLKEYLPILLKRRSSMGSC